MNISLLHDYETICARLTDINTDNKSLIEGKLEVSIDNIGRLQKLSRAELCNSGVDLYKDGECKVTKDVSDLTHSDNYKGYLLKIELRDERIHDMFMICHDWDSLLSYPEYVLNPVKAVYIHSEKKLYEDSNANDNFGRYCKLARVCNLITKVSSALTSSNEHLIVFGQSLEISFRVDSSILNSEIDPDPLEEILSDEHHKEAKNALVKEALVSFLKQHDVTYRFTHLLRHFNAFTTQLLSSYEQYVSAYSFDKVRREYQEKKTEYIVKINKTFDDVATKTFAIPAGVWLAASQIELVESLSSLEFYKNITFVLMVLVLGLIVCFNVFGQFSTLNALKTEYSGLFERLKLEFKGDEIEIENATAELLSRYEIVWWKLAMTIVISFVLFAFVVTLLALAINT